MTRLASFGLCAALWAVLPATGQDADLPSQARLVQSRTVFSTTRRFIVTGLPAVRAAEVARWADDVADRLQTQLGPLPLERGQSIRIEGRERVAGDADVAAEQACRDGRVEQVLLLRGLEAIDVEQAEEALGSLLVSRYIQALQDPAARCEQPARAPDWLTVGLVHRSRSDLRRRNRDAALSRWKSGELEAMAVLLESYVMPAGRWPRKADAMVLVEWLLEQPRGLEFLQASFRAQAAGRPPDAAWWAEQWTGGRTLAAAEREWDLWIAAQREHARPVGPGDVRDLLALHLLSREALAAADAPGALAGQPLSALIAHRGEGWCRTLALRHAIQLRLASIGQEPEALAMAEAHAVFLDALANGSSARRLNALWKTAGQRRDALEALVAARGRFLDAVEERYAPSARAPDAVQRYLDEVESRLPPRN